MRPVFRSDTNRQTAINSVQLVGKKSVKVFVTIDCSKPPFQDCLKAGGAYYALLQRDIRNRNGGIDEEEKSEEEEKGEEAKEEERKRG